tara:strand:+ start:183 stop:761 length:579 start_codon:yes stop_codon:yes gene_type:complete
VAAEFKNLKNTLNSWGQKVVNDAKQNLRSGGKGGGNLEKSIDFNVEPDGDGFVVEFSMADYGTFQDKGVKGAGGKIKSGKNEGTWGGRRYYTTWEGNRKDSPYKFGSGKGKKNGIYKGIASFMNKKNINRSKVSGKFISATGIKIAIVRTIWIKGIHGISFFQKAIGYNIKTLPEELLGSIKKDIINSLKVK